MINENNTTILLTPKTSSIILLNSQNFSQLILNDNFSLLEVFDDINKNLKFFLFLSNDKIIVMKLENLNKLQIKDDLIYDTKLSNLNTNAFCIFLNRIYLVNNLTSVYMIDIEKKKLFNILLSNSDNTIELCNNHSYVFVDTKIIFTGGIKNDNSLNNLMSSFDISTYKFDYEKVKENNFIARHSHGSICVVNLIYVFGGFTTIEEDDNKISEVIQVMKFDNLMNNWMELEIKGIKPKMMIRPQIKVIRDDYLLAFSEYKYPKIWYLNVKTNSAQMINLNIENFSIYKNMINSLIFTHKEKTDDNNEEIFNIIYPNEDKNLVLSNFSLVLN